MKQTELKRKTPLVAKSQLRRTGRLNTRSSHAAKPRRNTGPTPAVGRLVRLRSDGWCEWPGCWLVAADVHHRLNRKNGGRHGEMAVQINQAGWLLHACRPHHDLVTSPVGEDLVLAREMGWLLHEGEDARQMAALTRHGRVLLADDGTYFDYAEEAS